MATVQVLWLLLLLLLFLTYFNYLLTYSFTLITYLLTHSLTHYAACSLQPGHYSSLTAPNIQPTANQERNDQCGNQHHSRELLMMDIVVPETC